MSPEDGLRFSAHALTGHRARSLLMLLAMAIGVASVVLLTALGEGARRYVNQQFSSLGSNLLILLPGRTETTGGAPPLLGSVPRELTLDDALALRRIPGVKAVAPITVGSAPVSSGRLSRDVLIFGSTADMLPVRQLAMRSGQFLPDGDPRRAAAVAVLGAQTAAELFPNQNAVGQTLRINDWRYRVIGVLDDVGESFGMNTSDVVIVPVAAAQALFDVEGLFRVLVEVHQREAIPRVQKRATALLKLRHDGEDDVTVIAQDAMLATFDNVLRALTLGVAGIAAISLAVAGILTMNVMLVAVSQRTSEIGLLKALGAPQRQILTLFVTEAALLSLAGALAGLALAQGLIALAAHLWPDFPIGAPTWALFAACGTALLVGVLFGLLPARRAARLDPVAALAGR
jgi:putative ABC transport system permease protein